MDKFREAELSQGSELSRVLNEIKKTEARINHTEGEVLNLEQHISGVKVAIEVLQTERKVIQEKGDKCKVMTDLLEKSIKRQAKMLRAIEVPTNDFLKAKEAFLLDTDERIQEVQHESGQVDRSIETENHVRQLLVEQMQVFDEEVSTKTASYQAQIEKEVEEAEMLSRDLDCHTKKLFEKKRVQAQLQSELQNVTASIRDREDTFQKQREEVERLDSELSRASSEAAETERAALEAEAAAAECSAQVKVGGEEASTTAGQIEQMKVENHGLNFTFEAKKHILSELEAARAQLASVTQAVENAKEQELALREAPMQKMVQMEIRDKMNIAGQVAERRLTEIVTKEDSYRKGEIELAELSQINEGQSKCKSELEGTLEQVTNEVNAESVTNESLADQLSSVKKTVASSQEVLTTQTASLDKHRQMLADLESAKKKTADLQSELDAIDVMRKSKRDGYEATNDSLLADIRTKREKGNDNKERLRSLELEVNVLDANLNTVHAANRKKFEEAKAQMLDRVEDAIEKAYAAKEKKAAEERAAKEKIAAEEKAAKEKRAAEEKAGLEKRAAEERAAKEKRAAEVKAAKEKKLAEEKAAKEKKAAEEKAAKEKKAEEEKAAKERRAAEGKRIAEEKAAMDKKAAAAQAVKMPEDVLEMEMEWSDEQRAAEERVAAAIRAAAESAAAERAAEEKAATSEKVTTRHSTPKPATNRKFRGLYSATHSPVELDEEVPLDTNSSGGVSGGRGKAGQAGAIKRVSFAKSLTKSPCYTANPLNKVSTSSGRKPTPVRPILNKSKDSDGKDSRQDTPVPRGRRTLSAAATKKSPAASRISALKNPFGFDTSSEEDEDMFASNSRFAAKKVTPAKPRRPAPIPLAKRLSTASSSKSPYKIFGSKNNTPTKETINSPKSPADDDSDF